MSSYSALTVEAEASHSQTSGPQSGCPTERVSSEGCQTRENCIPSADGGGGENQQRGAETETGPDGEEAPSSGADGRKDC